MDRKIKIKVCGMRESHNIAQLIKLPIDYIGFIFYSKSPRFVEATSPFDIPENIKKTGVFVNENLDYILNTAKIHQLHAVQLHGSEASELCQILKSSGLEVIKAFGIDDTFDWSELESYPEHVDYFLFDTKTPAHGGSGKTFNWQQLEKYPYPTPYFLSGGIGIENIKQVSQITDDRLYALDLNSKFETEPALKDIKVLTEALSII